MNEVPLVCWGDCTPRFRTYLRGPQTRCDRPIGDISRGRVSDRAGSALCPPDEGIEPGIARATAAASRTCQCPKMDTRRTPLVEIFACSWNATVGDGGAIGCELTWSGRGGSASSGEGAGIDAMRLVRPRSSRHLFRADPPLQRSGDRARQGADARRGRRRRQGWAHRAGSAVLADRGVAEGSAPFGDGVEKVARAAMQRLAHGLRNRDLMLRADADRGSARSASPVTGSGAEPPS